MKARQHVEFYSQGKVQLGKTNITRYSCPTIILLYIPDPGLKQLEKVDVLCEGSTIALQINYNHCSFLVVEFIPTIVIPKANLEWCRVFSKSEPPSRVVGKARQFPLSNPGILWKVSFLST